MEETRSGKGTLKSLTDPNLVFEVSYEFRLSCRLMDPPARVRVDVKRMALVEENKTEIPAGEYLLIEHESFAKHRIRNFGMYIGWHYLAAE
jgi:hypothetical protein